MNRVVFLRSVVVLLGRFPALSGIDLEVQQGEVVVVRGGNGAGKTTLLRLCAGLLRPYAGEARILGSDFSSRWADLRLCRSKVGFLGHETRLYEDLTVWENMRFAAQLSDTPAQAIQQALEQVKLPSRLHSERVFRLSQGQRRRTALAAVALKKPALWLLDEPHSSMDAEGRQCVDDLIAGATASGAAVIVVSHENLGAADPAANPTADPAPSPVSPLAGSRTVWMSGGRLAIKQNQ